MSLFGGTDKPLVSTYACIPVCWGSNFSGQTSSPAGERFVAISSGTNHICALRHDGSPVCWGDDEFEKASPPDGERFSSISSGGSHTCALRASGSAVCWGGRCDWEPNVPASWRNVRFHQQRQFSYVRLAGFGQCGMLGWVQ